MMGMDRQYKRVYDKDKNVYEAAMERLDYIFNNFERIYLSFSGGKDSGVMLNLTIDYMRERGITKKIGVMVMDNETNYWITKQTISSLLILCTLF
jgi:predicted phosphoadenosine phosphosulfate sulfurtransferase